jgi:Flp pilus assembly protein TadB
MRYRWDPAYPGSTHRAGPNDGSGLRVSDAERNEVAEKLSRHFADGRLDQAEFKTRLDRALGAVTRGDLDGLFHDLPHLTDDPAPPKPPRRRFLPVAVLLVVAAVVTGAVVSSIHATWVLVVLLGLFVWQRAGRRRRFVPGSTDVRHYGPPG